MINDKGSADKGAKINLFRNAGRLLSLSFVIRHSSFLLCLSFFIFHFSFSLAAGQTQRGIASYYSKKATGARTASGERLHHDSLTCAHRTYPFGTLLKVTNPANGRVVVVRVTDRGPFGRGRIIDLSWGAARQLGILTQGIASVVVERVNETIVPLRDTTQVRIPELEIATQTGIDMKPVWQDSLQVDHKAVHQQMELTATKSWFSRFVDYFSGK